jgi:TIR domain
LEGAGIRCWIANRDVPYGRDYQEAIVDALDQAISMVLVFSNNANHSDDVAREVALASEHKILILPVRIEDARPTKALRYQLANRQYIDLYEDREQKMKSIIQTLSKVRRTK